VKVGLGLLLALIIRNIQYIGKVSPGFHRFHASACICSREVYVVGSLVIYTGCPYIYGAKTRADLTCIFHAEFVGTTSAIWLVAGSKFSISH